MKQVLSRVLAVGMGILCSLTAAWADGNASPGVLHPVRLVEITSDYYPGEKYYLGYMESEDHSIAQFFYEENNGKIIYYSWEQMNAGDIPIIQTSYNGIVYDLVRVTLNQSLNENAFQVELNYLKNAITGSRRINTLKLAFNPQKNNYELLYGLKVEEPITQARAITNFIGSIPVGIDYVIYSK
jgi:hypothetical protein